MDPTLTIAKLRTSVLPAIEDYWRADAVVMSFLDQRLPGISRNSSHTSCGIAALSAFYGESAAIDATSKFEVPWINRTMMESVLSNMGVDFSKVAARFPKQGIALVQWTGPKLKRDFRGSALAYTHWIAVIDNFIFDVNWPSWLPLKSWQELVADEIQSFHRADGWKVLTGYDISGVKLPKSKAAGMDVHSGPSGS